MGSFFFENKLFFSLNPNSFGTLSICFLCDCSTRSGSIFEGIQVIIVVIENNFLLGEGAVWVFCVFDFNIDGEIDWTQELSFI
jgi:hypothetical protein